jgi:type II secretory pathway predicted ATPase ExeA
MNTTYIEMSHPEARREHEERDARDHTTTLLDLGKKIDAQRKLRTPVPSDRSWAKEWPGLGSAKTWSRILRGDVEGIDVAARIPSYRAVLKALEAQASEWQAEDLYDDLAGAEEVMLECLRLKHHHGKDRLILIEGGSGSGKTSSLDLLAASEGHTSIRRVEANEAWKSLRVAMGDILKAYGYGSEKKPLPATTGDRLDSLLEIVGRSGRCFLCVDEAHHATGAVLNLFKTLLNRTEVLLVLAGMSTLFLKLRITASEEAKQLIHNRLFARIVLGSPDAEGVRMFLARRLRIDGSAWRNGTLNELAATAANAGHWSFIRRVRDHLQTSNIAMPDDADLMSALDAAKNEIAA